MTSGGEQPEMQFLDTRNIFKVAEVCALYN